MHNRFFENKMQLTEIAQRLNEFLNPTANFKPTDDLLGSKTTLMEKLEKRLVEFLKALQTQGNTTIILEQWERFTNSLNKCLLPNEKKIECISFIIEKYHHQQLYYPVGELDAPNNIWNNKANLLLLTMSIATITAGVILMSCAFTIPLGFVAAGIAAAALAFGVIALMISTVNLYTYIQPTSVAIQELEKELFIETAKLVNSTFEEKKQQRDVNPLSLTQDA